MSSFWTNICVNLSTTKNNYYCTKKKNAKYIKYLTHYTFFLSIENQSLGEDNP